MVEVEREVCDRCGTCVGICPVDALTMGDWLEVDGGRCTDCGRCVKICPFGALASGGGSERGDG